MKRLTTRGFSSRQNRSETKCRRIFQQTEHETTIRSNSASTPRSTPQRELWIDLSRFSNGSEFGSLDSKNAALRPECRYESAMKFPGFILAAVICFVALTSQAQTQISAISLERTSCYGTCPSYKVIASRDGRIQYEGKDFVTIKGKRISAISPRQFAKLAKKVEEIGFFKLHNEYSSVTNPEGSSSFVTDQPTYITIVTRGTVTKKVENYYGGPKRLYEFEQLIDEITNSAQWTGHPDLNKDIPYYDSFPPNRTLKFRGLLETARWESKAPGNVKGWKSKYILMFMKNSKSLDITAPKSIDLAPLDGYIVEVTGTLTNNATGSETFNISKIRRIRRYADS